MSIARDGRDTSASLYYLECLDHLREEHLDRSLRGETPPESFWTIGEAAALARTKKLHFTAAIRAMIMPPDKAAAAWDALTKARGLAAAATEIERALIDALATRYANPQPDDRRPLDEAYAAAMRAVSRKYPADADIHLRLFVRYASKLYQLKRHFETSQPRNSPLEAGEGQAG